MIVSIPLITGQLLHLQTKRDHALGVSRSFNPLDYGSITASKSISFISCSSFFVSIPLITGQLLHPGYKSAFLNLDHRFNPLDYGSITASAFFRCYKCSSDAVFIVRISQTSPKIDFLLKNTFNLRKCENYDHILIMHFC